MRQPFPAMCRREILLGTVWFLIYFFFMSALIELLLTALGIDYDLATLNAVYFLLNFLITALVFYRFLAGSLSEAAHDLPKLLKGVVLGFASYLLLTILPDILFSLLPGDLTIPNDDTVTSIAENNYYVMFAGAVLLAPLTEEALIRGLVFGSIRRKNRAAAYAVTAVLFAAIHMLDYLGDMNALSVFYNLMVYGFPSLALCLCYEYSGTIWAPIVLHAIINAIGMAGI